MDHYRSSTFNTCPYQILPGMTGPELKLAIKPGATPTCHTIPHRVPLHWKEQVEEGLKRDVKMDIIEELTANNPAKWCHKMVVTSKPGSPKPRRTVDMSALKTASYRLTHNINEAEGQEEPVLAEHARNIATKRMSCISCDETTPSQSPEPPITLITPEYSFQHICSDFFSLTLTSDGGPEYTAGNTQEFLRKLGVHYRLTSVGFPHANQKAERSVGSAERVIRDTVKPNGELDPVTLVRRLLSGESWHWHPGGPSCMTS